MKRAACWILCAALAGNFSFAQGLTQFYVTATAISDTPPFGSDFVLDVTPKGADVRVRYIRIGPLGSGCWRTITVKAVETMLRDTTPAKIVGTNNPCAVSPEVFSETLGKYGKTGTLLSSVSFGIVAKCGEREVALRFPYRAQINLERLKQGAPRVAELLNLWDEVKTTAFGSAEPFQGSSVETDLDLQQAGAAIVPELMSGRFDRGFAGGSISKQLSDYRGPVRPADYTVQLMNADAYQFASYVAPAYPPAAKVTQAHGRVLLQLRMDRETGEVQDVVALNGDPVLTPAATGAAMKWRFVPGTVTEQPIHAMLDFAWRCP